MSYLTEERRLIQQTARDFAMKEVLPVANELDTVKGDIPMSLRDQMGDLGYFGILIPEEYEGLGLGVFEYVLVTEELARAWMSVASIIARGNGLGGGFSEEQRRAYLPRMARGEFLGAYAMSGVASASQLVQFDLAGIAVSAGSACSSGSMKPSRVLEAMRVAPDIAGCTIRVSFGPETSAEDVERFLAEWRRIAAKAGTKAA